ncbi:MBL fold metallo-hydrolase [candidate division WOR-3 bacterium JGI_Cruoil_03_44_89]|uniref:MBL fold metallo-hydrolase n=1 Tax=candidate division WOR-3 bacterium JGI_Cruoil_03_44_89 TaxID=1973748 RepID=A0A235BVI5_UNCW3|nr:MAG: MBL fold metallo-hydrolase [candidate division WOR-3 bacterium JGI_Cruoil_03_44_89]
MIKITIVYDNEAAKKNLRADWGFSCFIEVYGKRILFDTGANGAILLDNMKKLRIKPAKIGEIFISHAHGDHTGGLSDFLKVNPVKVYVPSSYNAPRNAKEVIKVTESLEIHENIFSTGELRGIEQSLVVKTEKGVVVIVGCSHPGVGDILNAASQFGKPYALIGGLHGFRDFDLLGDLEFVCATHCTQFKADIKSHYPEKYVDGGVGKEIEIS